MIVVLACYDSNLSFNEEYYFSNHVPLVDKQLKPLGMHKQEVTRVLSLSDGSAAPYQTVTSLYFDSLEAFQAASQHPDAAPVFADIPNFYPGFPSLMIGNVKVEG